MDLAPHLASVAALHGHVLADTVLTRIVPSASTGFQRTVATAATLAVILAYLSFAAAVWAVIKMRGALDDARASLDQVGQHLRALTENATQISHDVAAVTKAAQEDLHSVHETVHYANERARTAISSLADRVDSFNDAIETVQHETQDVVISAVSALKGIRAGVAAIRGKKPARKAAPKPPEPDDDAPAPDLPARPRLRRRARH